MGAQLKVASEVGFARRQNHPLSKLLKSLTAESQDAVDTLVALMKSTDQKIKLAAATKLLEFQESVAKSIENDSLMRIMANAKYGGPKQLDYEDDDSPDVDFSVVQQVE